MIQCHRVAKIARQWPSGQRHLAGVLGLGRRRSCPRSHERLHEPERRKGTVTYSPLRRSTKLHILRFIASVPFDSSPPGK